MQIADSKDEVLRVGLQRINGAPPICNTTLGLGFDSITSAPSMVCPPSTATSASMASSASMVSQAMAATPLNFMVPFMASHTRVDDGCVRQSPPVQLELLPLHPTSHRALLSSSVPAFTWPQPSVTSYAATAVSRGIDVNQIPSSADCDDAAESSPSGVFSRFSTEPLRRSDGGLPSKREREKLSDQEQERTCEVSSRGSDEEECGGTRKKLRLSKDQSALLEESFKEHSTLNPKQKNALAKQLNLRPRQVEVWFQNRRARTKLKQTEVDCELLKRCCESLTEENRRLQKELQELRAIKVAPPCVIAHDFYMPLPAATLTMCPSCERLGTLDNRTLGFAKPQLPHQFSQPSAAC